jgi:putative nucleotidyltransferase with HDIG domain
MIKKINVALLRIGMYISQLDRSWMETPFLSHKFEVKTSKQIDQLKEYCNFVYIDTERGIDTLNEVLNKKLTVTPEIHEEKKIRLRETPDSPSTPGPENIRRALELHDQAKEVIGDILEDVRIGQIIQTIKAKKTVESIITSLIEDKNALLCLIQLRSKDEYTVSHSINVSILSMAFGRRLKLSKEELELLGLGALLHDIGKMKVPLEILNKPGKLSDAEFEIMKKHVLYSAELLKNTEDFPSGALDLVLQHHERVSGKGYPFGLKGSQISLFGSIVSIVDVYDAITTNRVYRSSTPPHEAIKWIYEWSSADFDKQLVEHFIKTVGIFPIGSQVEINHSDIGVVLSSNPENALKPSVLLLYDSKKQPYRPPRMIDLMEKDLFSNKSRWSVTKMLGPVDKEKMASL